MTTQDSPSDRNHGCGSGCRPSHGTYRGDGTQCPPGEFREQAGTTGPQRCGCWRCREDRGDTLMVMVLCAQCGNKRCPHATDHDNACTESNDPGQPGSIYEQGSGAATMRRFQTIGDNPR